MQDSSPSQKILSSISHPSELLCYLLPPLFSWPSLNSHRTPYLHILASCLSLHLGPSGFCHHDSLTEALCPGPHQHLPHGTLLTTCLMRQPSRTWPCWITGSDLYGACPQLGAHNPMHPAFLLWGPPWFLSPLKGGVPLFLPESPTLLAQSIRLSSPTAIFMQTIHRSMTLLNLSPWV